MQNPIPIEKPLESKIRRLRAYLMLTKPGIIMGNSITASAGFALASRGQFDGSLFAAMLFGLVCIIGSACVFNNYIDRYADQKMARTRHRALVKGTISVSNAISFGILLCLIGALTLLLFTNPLSLWAALIGFSSYVFLYSFWKYRTSYGTLIGSIAGAMPPLVGYCAVSECLDLGAALLFLLVVLWQMPHFYAIALYRLDDYTAAAIPVLPVEKGIFATKVEMLFYVGAFAIAAILPSTFNITGNGYLFIAILLGIGWLGLSIRGFWIENDRLWARQMFLFSLVAITLLSLFLAIDAR